MENVVIGYLSGSFLHPITAALYGETLTISSGLLKHLFPSLDLIVWAPIVVVASIALQRRHLRKDQQKDQQSEASSGKASEQVSEDPSEQTSEERYAALVEAAPVGIFRGDTSGRCFYVNRRWCQMTGCTPAMTMAEGWQQALAFEDRQRVGDEWMQAVRRQDVTDFECQIQRPDGTQQWVHVRIVAEQDSSRQVVGYVGTVTDIEARKQLEQVIRQDEARKRALLNVLPDLIMRISRTGIFLEFLALPTFRVLGEPKDWVGKHMSEALSPAITQQRLAVIEQVLRSQEIQIYEQDFSIEGDIQIEEVRVVPYGDDEVLFLVRDISDRKQAELALKQSEARSRSILKAIPDLMFRVNKAGIFCQLFAPERSFSLVSQAEATGKLMIEVLPIEVATRHLFYLEEALTTGELQVYEQTLEIGDRIQEEEVRVIKSRPDEVLFIVRDISDRKQAERALKQKLEQEQALCQIIRAIRKSLDLPTIFATATAETARLVPDMNCSVVQYLPEQQRWKALTKFHQDTDSLEAAGFEFSDVDNPFATKLKQFQIVQVTDTRDIKDPVNQHIAQLWPGAWLLIPLVIEEELWGSFTLSLERYGFIWERWLIELAQVIAAQLEVAIQQAQLYQQVEAEKQKLMKSERRFRGLAANLPGVLIQYILYPDGSDGFLYVSPGCCHLWEITEEEILSNLEVLWDMVHLEDKSAIKESVIVSARELKPWSHEWRITTPSGRTKWLQGDGRPERSEDGSTVWDTIIIDVSDRAKIQAQLKHDSLHDSLTGLPNRALLTERLDLSLKKANRHSDYAFSVLFLDLDNFKLINDSLGHLVGDELLKRIAQLLSETIRETDLAARLGGDEFVVLLDDLDSEAEAEQIAQRILALLQDSLQVNRHEIFIGTSIGIVIGADRYQSPDELLRDADLAMYSAKQNGRGHYAMFDPTMHSQAIQRLQAENNLRTAIQQQEFVLLYQPIVDLETQTIQGFEALIRWQHPEKGLLLPTAFIDVAEETGLIEPLGEWILQTACKQLAQWRSQRKLQHRNLSISINLSSKQLQRSLLSKLKKTLAAYAIEPNCLGLEVTESMLAQDIESKVQLLQEIKEIGVRISIDDFGAGYSSLSYLHQLPVDALKVDRSFVSPANANDHHQTIAKAIAALGKLLNLEVIAEGIETSEQLAWLRSFDCKYGQGHLFSPPVTAEKATHLLEKQAASGLSQTGLAHQIQQDNAQSNIQSNANETDLIKRP